MPLRSILLVCLTLGASMGASASVAKGTQPSFDCQKAESSAEELICADDKLATLDRRLAERYGQAVETLKETDDGGTEALDMLRATQRGWIKGRDDCWKSDDLRTCVKDAYLMREADLVARWMLQKPGAIVAFACDGNPANEVTAFFFDTELPAVRLEYGDSIDTGSSVPTASGSRYNASFGRFIWIKGNEATFSWQEGTEMKCVKAN